MKEWLANRETEDADADENDPERPNYDEMIEAEREKLRELREKDEGFLEEFVTALKEKQVEVVDSI